MAYTYEYQGNAPKLVHTPLTDKCYLTLTQGMAMGCGGNPYGPAGTGKTESVKALGAALGRQVLVFNCDEGIDFHSMVGRRARCPILVLVFGCDFVLRSRLHLVAVDVTVTVSGVACRCPGSHLHGSGQVWRMGLLR